MTFLHAFCHSLVRHSLINQLTNVPDREGPPEFFRTEIALCLASKVLVNWLVFGTKNSEETGAWLISLCPCLQ